MSLCSLVVRRWKTPPWLRLYHSTGCFGYRPNKGLISKPIIPGKFEQLGCVEIYCSVALYSE